VATNLIAQLINDFRGDALSRVASALGETPAKTEAALGAAVPALFGGLANKVSTTAGANDLLDLIRRNKLDAGQYAEVSSALKAPDGINTLTTTGRSLMDFAMNGRSTGVGDWISSIAGIKRTSATSLIALVLPLVLGRIARLVGSAGLTASGLQSLLGDQKAFLKDAPAGLASALGIADMARAASVGTYETARPVVTRQEPVPAAYVPEERRGSAWWMWALPLLLLALIPLFLWMRKPTTELATNVPADTRPVATTGTPSLASLGEFVEKRLPHDVTLRIPSRGVESKLLAYIEDSSVSLDKESWFSFDRLEFETDSAILKPSSREQLRNVADILRAYPQVNLKIGGYTDNVGDAAYNLKLSSDRANNTMNEIAGLGVDRSRLEAEGYGENHPIADNSTPEGRQRNRRIDVRVAKK